MSQWDNRTVSVGQSICLSETITLSLWDNRSVSVGQLICLSGTIDLSQCSGTIDLSQRDNRSVSVGQSNCLRGSIDLSQLDNRSVSVGQSICLSGTFFIENFSKLYRTAINQILSYKMLPPVKPDGKPNTNTQGDTLLAITWPLQHEKFQIK